LFFCLLADIVKTLNTR